MGGGDKCLRPLGPKTILQHVIDRARPQVDRLVLNANGDARRFAAYGLPVMADSVPDFAGPLAGILAGLDWAATEAPDAAWVASFAGDAPFLPRDLVARMAAAVAGEAADLACARSAGQAHPVVGLWPMRLRADLRRALAEEGVRKVDAWTGRHRLVAVDFAVDPVDPFFNANRPEDLAEAERLLPRLRD
ncbi:MAG: molybdenum cofactor guanylyltransferase MobA [Alphaproteobacteria bacterium]|nr:molybdenum cofactor guanylyltransferase MobA [Alphaproteobacteria bacterium]